MAGLHGDAAGGRERQQPAVAEAEVWWLTAVQGLMKKPSGVESRSLRGAYYNRMRWRQRPRPGAASPSCCRRCWPPAWSRRPGRWCYCTGRHGCTSVRSGLIYPRLAAALSHDVAVLASVHSSARRRSCLRNPLSRTKSISACIFLVLIISRGIPIVI